MELQPIIDQLDTARAQLVAAAVDRVNAPEVVSAVPLAQSVTITGALTREPEIRYTREGIATCQLNVAVSGAGTGDAEGNVGFFDVVALADIAENVTLSLTKGMHVVVSGALNVRTWEDDDGGEHAKVEITASDIGASLRWATVEVHKVERRATV